MRELSRWRFLKALIRRSLKYSKLKIDFFTASLQGGEERRNRASGKRSGTGTGSRLGTAHQPKNQVSVSDFSCFGMSVQ
jgi:hypothetical protein